MLWESSLAAPRDSFSDGQPTIPRAVWRLLRFPKRGLREGSDSAVLHFQPCSLRLPRQPQALFD
ncbi:hypothetical protein EK904_001118 [Melospiza melodia maxima]|nr:hypothetical protein EK904_001118 [Melospiza melodia maxima]